jgi:hypothetical protein
MFRLDLLNASAAPPNASMKTRDAAPDYREARMKSWLLALTLAITLMTTPAFAAIDIHWSPIIVPPGLPPSINPCLIVVCVLDVEGIPIPLPLPIPPIIFLGVTFSVNPGVSTIPGGTFFDIVPGPLFSVDSTDNTTFLSLTANAPIEFVSELEILQSFRTHVINPFAVNEISFTVTTATGSESGQVSPLAVPEPSTLLVLGSGLIGLLGAAWLRRTRVA